jgi:ketosteroid isomerase-like protein
VSAENVELVRRWFACFAEGNLGEEFCDPDVEIRNWAESPAPGPYRGLEGLRKWWRDVHDPDIAEDLDLFVLEELIDLGSDRVLTIQRATGVARYSRIQLDQRWGSILTVRDGRVLSAIGYSDPAAARRAAGLDESGES